MKSIKLYTELKPRLSVMHVILRIPRERSKTNCRFNVLASGLSLKWDTDPVTETEINFKGVHLRPTSCHNMQWKSNEELHLRIQINSKKGGDVISKDGMETTTSIAFASLNAIQQENFSCCCGLCGSIIIDHKKFKRVLPMPSDNWFEASETWFCHNHDADEGRGQGIGITAREGDCLVSESYFLIHKSSVKPQALKDASDRTIVCTRCQHHVGHIFTLNECVNQDSEKSTICLFTQMLSIPHAPPDVNTCSSDVGESIADWLINQMKQFNSYRFIIESRPAGGLKQIPYIVVWLMDLHTIVYQSSIGAEKSHTCDVVGKPIVKILYKDCFRSNTKILGEEWRKDLTVQSLELPEVTAIKLLNDLIESTKFLPVSMKSINNLYMGYLPKKNADSER